MAKNKIPEIGLVVWTELEPQWIVETSTLNGRKVLTAQSPIATHPPAAFTFTSFKDMEISQEELLDISKTVMSTAKRNYRSTQSDEHFVDLKSEVYGALSGYEVTFEGIANGQDVDVRIFLGQADSKPPVLLQAYTLRGKLHAISENIRRSWSNVAYLEADAETSLGLDKEKD